MLSKLVRVGFVFAFATSLCLTWSPGKASAGKLNRPATTILYSQAPSSSGGLLASSWLGPSGSQKDRYVWDNFTLGSASMITEVAWIGGYDPAYSGAGGAVVDPPLGTFRTGGNAGETPYGTLGGIPMYNYQYVLPTPIFVAGGNVYWVQIEAWQRGTSPDWGMTVGNAGDGWHFLKIPREPGYTFQFAPGDAAFTLWGQLTPHQIYLPLMSGM